MIELPHSAPISQLYTVSYGIALIFLVIGVTENLINREVINRNQARNLLCLISSLWTLAAPLLFIDWYWVLATPGFFLLINLAALRWQILPTLYPEQGRLGAFWFTLVLIAAVTVGWLLAGRYGIRWRLLAPLTVMPAGLTDAAGAFFGRLWGKRKLHGERTVIGSLWALVGALVGYTSVLLVFGITSTTAWLVAVATGVLTALTELFTPSRLDNLTTGLVAGAGAVVILFSLG